MVAVDTLSINLDQREALHAGLNAARLAPSAHNSQPWVWRCGGDSVVLGWDAARRLPAGDPHAQYLHIGLGAAAESFRLGVANSGSVATTTVDPNTASRRTATIRLQDGRATDADLELVRQIAARKTTRLPFDRQPIAASDVHELVTVAQSGGCDLAIVQSPARIDTIAALIADGTARNFADREVFSEFTDWLRFSGDERPDGLTLAALELSRFDSLAARALMRPQPMRALVRLGLHRVVANSQGRLARQTGTYGLFSAPSNTPHDLFVAGGVMLRVWLCATALGLRVHPMTAAMDHTETRAALVDAFGVPRDAALVLCFRVGHASPGVRSARLPLDQIVMGGCLNTMNEDLNNANQ